MKTLDVEALDRLDAFRVRFCDLKDSLGSKTFRSLLKLEEEDAKSQLDIINKMDKRGIISSFEEWGQLREIRNLFSHDYPDSDEQRAESLNLAFGNTMKLIDTLDNVKKYVEREIKMPMKNFTFLVPK
jgi:transposase